VEDSRNGLRSLRAAGVVSVMIPDLIPFSEELAPYVDHCLEDLNALCPLIDRLNWWSRKE
jgi:beta-phosphoglucomutase-like phosphatase (HAD superfamily)